MRHSLTKWLSFFSSFYTLSIDTSCIKIGACFQELSPLEFNFITGTLDISLKKKLEDVSQRSHQVLVLEGLFALLL